MATTNEQRETDAVLSSVRRLVSEEVHKVDTGGVVERLLLTPAFRVDGPSLQADKPRREPTPLEQRIAELERAVGGKADDWEPDGSEVVDKETPERFVLEPETRVDDGPGVEAPEETDTDEGPTEAAGEALADEPVREAPSTGTSLVPRLDAAEIDEDQLREIVAEMVRAELRGALGERITRNVRKLVRREIHRALLTRDLD